MSGRTERASEWVYRGIWGVLARWFKVPEEPPTLPGGAGIGAESFRPAPGFLRYLKFRFWLLLLIIDVAILFVWVVIAVASPIAGAILAIPALAIAVLPDIVAYVAIYLRYDTTWYVVSDRSMRIRRGIWTIHETTITFENVQNVSVNQGPLQRYFGIANVMVQTAGGGSGHGGPHGARTATAHLGLLEGLADATRIRDLIMAKSRATKGAGLGDDHPQEDGPEASGRGMWTAEHVGVLREIRELARGVGGCTRPG